MLGRVTARLASNPILPAHQWPLTLDAVVAHRVMRAKLGHRFGSDGLTAEDCAVTDALDLPLAKIGSGDGWVWAASRAVPSHTGQAVEWQHSSNDLGLYERRVPPDRAERLDEARAKWKPGRLPRVVTVTASVSWLVDTTDPDRLMAILSEVVAVGKGHARGYGQVTGWAIEEIDPFPWSADLRPLPEAGSGVIVGIRPPYWHQAQQREVAFPWP